MRGWKRFERYVFDEHLKFLLLVFFALSVVYVLGSFLDVLDDALERHVSLAYPLKVALFRLPMGLKDFGPLAILISVMLFLAVSSQNLEPVALRSLGIPSKVMLRPLLFQGAVVSVILLINASFLAPFLYSRAKSVYLERIKGKVSHERVVPVNMWVKDSGYFCNIGYFDEKRALLREVICFKRDKGERSFVKADEALWGKEGWVGIDVKSWKLGNATSYVFSKKRVLPLRLTPDELLGRRKGIREMSLTELVEVIWELSKEGINHKGYSVELFSRIFLSLAAFVMVLLAFPVGVILPRKGQVVFSFIKGVGLAVLFIGVFYGFTFAGRSGWMPPLLSAFLPVALFSYVGVKLIRRMEE